MEMLEKVFVVRFREFLKGEESAGCGNFEYCHAVEDGAITAMNEDMDGKAKELTERGLEPKSERTNDYGKIECNNGDIYEWWIDCLPIYERTVCV